MKKFIAGAASLMLCMGLHAQDFRINPSGYFENGGANVTSTLKDTRED